LGGNNQDEQGCDASSGRDSGPRSVAARIEPTFERRNLGQQDLDIDGTVEGLVHIDERKLTVGATAKLTVDVIAGEVIVYGSVEGNVRGKGKIEIKKDGSVNGDLTTGQIIIEDGAYFKGSIEIENSAEKEGDKNVFSQTASASAAPAADAGPKSI
jgi:cytoskeletal protein CcmA (bactofilin family)